MTIYKANCESTTAYGEPTLIGFTVEAESKQEALDKLQGTTILVDETCPFTFTTFKQEHTFDNNYCYGIQGE